LILILRDIIEMIESVGFEANYSKDVAQEADYGAKEQLDYVRDLAVSLIFVIPTFFVSMVFMMFFPHSSINMELMKEVIPGLAISDILLFGLSLPVQFGLGYRFYKGAWKSLFWLGTANMDVLISLGTSVAWFFSTYALIRNVSLGSRETEQFYETSVFLIFFILVGKYLECYAKGNTLPYY
jgi:P-type Cu+ transporter